MVTWLHVEIPDRIKSVIINEIANLSHVTDSKQDVRLTKSKTGKFILLSFGLTTPLKFKYIEWYDVGYSNASSSNFYLINLLNLIKGPKL